MARGDDETLTHEAFDPRDLSAADRAFVREKDASCPSITRSRTISCRRDTTCDATPGDVERPIAQTVRRTRALTRRPE